MKGENSLDHLLKEEEVVTSVSLSQNFWEFSFPDGKNEICRNYFYLFILFFIEGIFSLKVNRIEGIFFLEKSYAVKFIQYAMLNS